jgi:hypothetical protein
MLRKSDTNLSILCNAEWYRLLLCNIVDEHTVRKQIVVYSSYKRSKIYIMPYNATCLQSNLWSATRYNVELASLSFDMFDFSNFYCRVNFSIKKRYDKCMSIWDHLVREWNPQFVQCAKSTTYGSAFFCDCVVLDLVRNIYAHHRRTILQDFKIYLDNASLCDSQFHEHLEWICTVRMSHLAYNPDIAQNNFFFLGIWNQNSKDLL